MSEDTLQKSTTGKSAANRTAALFLTGLSLLHLGLVFRFPLAPDETYYWEWSRHPGYGYYDQGPMVAWVIHFFCSLSGNNGFGIRIGIVFASTLTFLFLYLTARDLLGHRSAMRAIVALSLTPLAMAGGFVAIYDPLVALFWAGALYFSSRALFFNNSNAWWFAGICFGLGLLSKHTMIFYLPCLLIFLLYFPGQRHHLREYRPYMALGLGLLVFSPNLIWQMNHHWMTFAHLFILAGKGTDHTALRRFGDFLGSQVGLLSPLLFFGLLGAMVWAWKRACRDGDEKIGFLLAMGLPTLLFFLMMTFKSKVQANWAICGWFTPPMLYAAWLENVPAKSLRMRYYLVSVALCGMLTLLLIMPELRGPLHLHISPRLDQMNKLYGGSELGAAAGEAHEEMIAATGKPVAVGAVTYDNAGRMGFYMPNKPASWCPFLGTRLNSYLLWNKTAAPAIGGNALLADDYAPDDPGLPPFNKIFDRVEPVAEPVYVYRHSLYREPVHVYYLYRCYGYRPNPSVEQPGGG